MQSPYSMHSPGPSPGMMGMGEGTYQQQHQYFSPPRTPVSSREPRMYSGRASLHQQQQPQGQVHHHGSSMQSPQGGGGGPTSMGPTSPRLDATFGVQQNPSSGSSGGGHQQQQSNSSGICDQDLIEHASKTMERLMAVDRQVPSLYKSLVQVSDQNAAIAGNRPVSGFMEYDYPALMQKHMMTDNQFSVIHSSPIPSELSEMLNQADVKYCHMGLFPDIFRAWMTIDSDLYLWDFRDGSDLSFYDGLKEPIITMALVPVKSSVFQNSIQHLLCIATASEIVILGFVLTDSVANGRPVMELVSQPIFVVPTEGTLFCVIKGTRRGRIFLGAKDGSIHEINYQAGRGWLTDRCWKTNLTRSYLSSFFKFISSSSANDPIKQIESDDQRNIVFTRSESGLLQAFDLGQDGSGFSRFGYLTFEGIVNEVVNISKKTLESNVVKKILTISPVTNGEISLVAVVDNGTRLYFTCYNPPTAALQGPYGQAPQNLQLVHVRMPPGYCTVTSLQKPSISHTAFHSNGVFGLAARSGQESDCFWLMTPYMYPSSYFSEVFTIQQLPGHTLDIKLIPSVKLDPALENLPDVITQHLLWQREIVVLTANGTTVFRAHKPYELLKCLMIEQGDPESISGHFNEFGVSKEQPLANSAFLAIHPSTRSELSVYDMAVKAFFMYGSGDVHASHGMGRVTSPFENTLDFNPNLVSTPRQDIGVPHASYASPGHDTSGYMSPPLAGSSPYMTSQAQQAHRQQYQSQNPQYGVVNDQLMFSPRHEAIYLVVGRILFNFWNKPLVQTTIAGGPGTPPIIVPNIKGDEVTLAITYLQSMIAFINSNSSLYMSRTNLNIGLLNLNTIEGRRIYHHEVEKNSIISLRAFLSLTLEVLNMWKILCDHQFHIVLHGVDNQLQNSTMKDLIVTGHQSVSVIINALISKYLGDNAAVDAISLRLREVCPTLFKSEDAIGSKVAEILSKVKNSDSADKEALLKESLMLSEKICGHGRVNVRNLCKQYADLGFPVGAVRLCVSAAKAADPEQQALNTVKSISTSSDPIGMQAFQSRAEIYRIVFDILDNYVVLAATNQSPVLRGIEERISPQLAQKRAEETIHAILTSDDEMFHISLYNWLLEKKQFDRLLEIKHPFLDSFLQRAADAVVSGKWPGSGVSANDTRVLDLLWRHHEMNQNHAAAAQILAKLAESTTTGLNLQQRLEYMSRAIICSKSCSRRGDLLETLEDKVEVAQIQKNILDSIMTRIAAISAMVAEEDTSGELKTLQDAVPKLNSQLLTITQLYTDFAHPLKLHDAKLEIFFAAGHGDKETVESVWSDIIEDELANNSRRTIEAQMEIIRRKLVSLGRKYMSSPTFFPVEFLIEHLETMKPQDAENVAWVFTTMLEVGINFSDLLIIYERLWSKLLHRPGGSGGDLQIAKVIMCMIDSFAKQELDTRTSFVHRPDLLEKCKDLIATMIVEFCSRFDPQSTQMTQHLNHVKDLLDMVNLR